MRALILAFAGVLAAGAIRADVLPDAPYVAVRGHAIEDVRPDAFDIRLNLNHVDANAGVARDRVESLAAQVIADLRKRGLGDRDIIATNLEVGAEYDFVDGRQVLRGTRARRQITATFKGVKALGEFMGALPAGNDLAVEGVTPRLVDELARRDALRERAIADSRRRAESMAKSHGGGIGAVFSVSDYPIAPSYSGPRPMEMAKMQMDAARSPEVVLSEGTLRLEEEVYAVFLLAR